MTRYEFQSVVAMDPTYGTVVKGGSGQVYAPLDTAFASPLAVFDRAGAQKPNIKTTAEGVTEEFYVDDQPIVWWRSGPYAFLISSFTGMVASTEAARADADSAKLAAQAAQLAAEQARDSMAATSSQQVADALNAAGPARTAAQAIAQAVGLRANTVDNFDDYKAILFSDGSVRAVPYSVTAPAAPVIATSSASATLVKLTWGAVSGATSYQVLRSGVRIATTGGTSLRDRTGTTGQTYQYTVVAVNAYGMHSVASAPVTLYLDPALNAAPSVQVTTWPAVLPSSGRALVRVNAVDADAQTLALALSTDVGSLQPTTDPSVWILTI